MGILASRLDGCICQDDLELCLATAPIANFDSMCPVTGGRDGAVPDIEENIPFNINGVNGEDAECPVPLRDNFGVKGLNHYRLMPVGFRLE